MKEEANLSTQNLREAEVAGVSFALGKFSSNPTALVKLRATPL